ncbi:MAG: hypothetical protein QXG27_02700 [Candidatus Bathyarchaeia archaeon]
MLSPFQYFGSNRNEETHKGVGISIIVDVGQVDDVLNFLSRFGYSKWSIVLTFGLICSGILENSTFVNTIKLYGELLPGLWIIQTETLEGRKAICDYLIEQWETYIGYRPYGFFMFQPDTYIANYLYSQGIYYIQGYCFDQYAVDWMTMRGGWQQPYYASEKHVLIPKAEGRGIIIFPHLIWDWRDSFEINHLYNTSPFDAWSIFNENYEQSKNYILSLMNVSLQSVKPFSYFIVQGEIFGWGGRFKDENLINFTDLFESIIVNAEKSNANLETFNETAKWFRDNFENNPTYSFTYVSPYSNKKCEWYFSPKYRITRYDGYVVGLIEYQKQKEDPYLTQIAHPDFNKSPNDPDACVDNSLTFSIDDFGNGQYRAPPKYNRFLYPANLESFPKFYNTIIKILKVMALIQKTFGFLPQNFEKIPCISLSLNQ